MKTFTHPEEDTKKNTLSDKELLDLYQYFNNVRPGQIFPQDENWEPRYVGGTWCIYRR